MAEHRIRAAGFWPQHTIRVATRVLPGATRHRHRQQSRAELHGLGRGALRAAPNTPSDATATDTQIVFSHRRRPLSCRLNLRHRWATLRTEDGKAYLRCQPCGNDETDLFAGTKSGREFDGVPPGIGSAVFGHGS